MLPLLSPSPREACAQGGDPNLGGAKATPTSGGKDSKPSGLAPHMLIFGVERKGRLDPKTSEKNASGSFFEEMSFKAESEDSLSFRIKSVNPSLGLQILGKNNAEVAVAKDPSGDFKIDTPTGGMPANGDYRVRVTGALSGRNAVPFTIKVNRAGLTSTAYSERFNKIYTNYRYNDPASVDETVAKLERLVREAPDRPTAFERLGIIYLEVRRDFGKAEWAMDRAIKADGVARIKISYDYKWRQMTKLRSGDLGFEDKRSGWLRIQAGKLALYDERDKPMVTLNGRQIKELSKTLVSAYNLVTITANNARKPYVFAPETMRQVEADLVIKLIQNHVVGKTIN
jgi:hypothetical protein